MIPAGSYSGLGINPVDQKISEVVGRADVSKQAKPNATYDDGDRRRAVVQSHWEICASIIGKCITLSSAAIQLTRLYKGGNKSCPQNQVYVLKLSHP